MENWRCIRNKMRLEWNEMELNKTKQERATQNKIGWSAPSDEINELKKPCRTHTCIHKDSFFLRTSLIYIIALYLLACKRNQDKTKQGKTRQHNKREEDEIREIKTRQDKTREHNVKQLNTSAYSFRSTYHPLPTLSPARQMVDNQTLLNALPHPCARTS